MAPMLALRDAVIAVADAGGAALPSSPPAREKLYASRSSFSSVALRLRARKLLLASSGRARILLAATVLSAALFLLAGLAGSLGIHPSSSVLSSDYTYRGGYTVLINTWKRNSLLKKAVAHYATCAQTDAIHVIWSEDSLPSDSLRTYLINIVLSQSQTTHKPYFKFELNEEDNLNNRFKPIEGIKSDAIFSVDDDVLVPCSTLDFAFNIWQAAPDTMVGFVPRMHWLVRKNDCPYYKYGGWWSVWWTGTYSMVLSKAAFFHKKYLDMYTHKMPKSIHDYVTRERNCEDIAMSLLVANATGVSPIWVQGKIHEIGSTGISSLKGHNSRRSKCLNDFISLYGAVPLVSTSMKAVEARQQWVW